MADNSSLRSQILIAMPSLHDPYFSKSIIIICEHSAEQGAMGFVLNQPTTLDIYQLVAPNHSNIEKDDTLLSTRIFAGGPLETDRGFILHDCDLHRESTIEVASSLFLTSSAGILDEIMEKKGPDNKVIAVGYAGWSPGQLEAEISANSWLITEYHPELVFNTPVEQQWLAAGKQLGVNLHLLNSQPGHA